MLELNQIHQGDCLELMKLIPTGSIDMILCDLPYGTTSCEWDSIIDMGKLWNEYERVIKDNGAIVLTANSRFTFTLYNSNPRLFRYKWIWEKNQSPTFATCNKMPMKIYEDVLVFYKKMPSYYPQMQKGESYKKSKPINLSVTGTKVKGGRMASQSDGDRYPTDIIKIAVHPRVDVMHPTQKPVALFEYLIKTYTNEGEVVLDNCSGSGTTAIACLNSNRHFICIEKDDGYYKKSLERITNHEPLLHLGDKC